jgi:hypothetical protein
VRTVAVGVALLVAVVSGCSASDETPAVVRPLASGTASETARPATPAASPDARVTTDPSEHSEQGEHSLPVEARPADAAGASAFARHYVATMQQALATSDATALEELSDPGCGGCRNVLSAIVEAAEAGRYVEGAEIVVDFAEAPAVRAGETIVDLRYRRKGGGVVDADGVALQTIAPEGPIDTQLRLRHSGTGWTVLGFRQVSA